MVSKWFEIKCKALGSVCFKSEKYCDGFPQGITGRILAHAPCNSTVKAFPLCLRMYVWCNAIQCVRRWCHTTAYSDHMIPAWQQKRDGFLWRVFIPHCWVAADFPMGCLAGDDVWRYTTIEGLCFLCVIGAKGLCRICYKPLAPTTHRKLGSYCQV
jgi:hypothetical protein